MQEFRIESSLDGNYLVAELEPQDVTDEIAVRVLRKDCPEFLIPFTMSNRNDRLTLRYRLADAMSLQYMDLQVTTEDFVKLYLRLLTPFVQGRDWFLDYHSLCVDSRYVYLNNRTWDIYYIYVPVVNYRNSESDILEFLKNFMNNIRVTDAGDFVVSVYRYFAGVSVTLSGLYELFRDQEERKRKGTGMAAGSAEANGSGGWGAAAPGPQGFSSAGSPAGAQGFSAAGSPAGPNASQAGGWAQTLGGPAGSVQGNGAGSYGTGAGTAGSGGGFLNGNMGAAVDSAGAYGGAAATAEPEEKKKGLGSLFGGAKKKDDASKKAQKAPRKKKEKDNTASSEVEDLFGGSASSMSGDDEFLDELLNEDKKSKAKSKTKEPKKSGRDRNAAKTAAADSGKKSGSFLDGILKGGKDKKAAANEAALPEAAGSSGSGTAAGAYGASYSAGYQGYQGSPQNQVMGGQSYYAYTGDDDDETEISAAAAGGGVHRCMELIDSAMPGAMQRIDLEFPGDHIMIGRISSNEQRPDVAFPADFKRIGRRHARIDRIGGKLYLIDLGSANYTFINGQRLVPNQPYELTDGAVVVFTEQKPVRYRVHC